jgi:hypothetical protein
LSAGPQALIRASAERDRANDERLRNYTWVQRSETRELNSSGAVKSTDVRVSEFIQIYGEPFERLVSKNGKSVSEKERAKQDEKINKLIRERQNETPEQRQKRLAEYDRKQAEKRAFVQEIAEAFNFNILPSESISGRNAYVLEGTPRPGFRPRRKESALLLKFRFRVWLNSNDCNLIKLDAQAVDTVSIGGIVARIAKGTRVTYEQTNVNDEVWLPRHIAVKADGRLLLLKKFNLEQDVSFSDYRKFRAESRITGVQELPPDSAQQP